MTGEQWKKLEAFFDQALELNGKARSAFLADVCRGDPELQAEAEKLIEAHEREGSFMDTPLTLEDAELAAGGHPVFPFEQIGPYHVIRQLGHGGMGEVFLAEDRRLGRKVALKVLPAGFTENPTRVRRFEGEAKAASALNHPNILTIYEVVHTDGLHAIAAEFVDGVTLRQRIADGGMGIAETLDVAVQVATALVTAHDAGIVHRDIKPENVMVRADGLVKVLDFGLAKLDRRPGTAFSVSQHTEPGTVMGTAQYMSPEQARGLAVDHRTDIFSLGVMIYELISGRCPFQGETTSDVIAAILQNDPAPLASLNLDLPPGLEQMIRRMLEKDLATRYQSAAELRAELQQFQRVLMPAQKDAQLEPPASRAKIHTGRTTKTRTVLVTLMTLAGLGLAGLLYFKLVTTPPLPLPLTDKDTILIADFINTTGDEVFDGTLKQALAVQLGQAPFLNVFSEERTRETLRYMNRSANQPVTGEIAREIAQRQSIKALLAGSISPLGSHYVISLEALNAQNGDSIAREQVEAESREQVLRRLGEAASKMRQSLGESLSSIEKYDTPIEQATTSSLDAFKAFYLARERNFSGKYFEAIPFYKRAVELDPNFAIAYAALALTYGSVQEHDLAAQFSQKAFDLRERTSERERFYISARYFMDVLRDANKTIEVQELWKETYPRDFVPHTNLAARYCAIGEFERGLAEAREGIRLNPDAGTTYTSLAICAVGLDRYDEARAVIEQAMARKVEPVQYRYLLYSIAFLLGDMAAMEQQVKGTAGTTLEAGMLALQSTAAASSGQLAQAREFANRSVDLARRSGFKEGASVFSAGPGLWEAAFGNCGRAKTTADRTLAISRGGNALSWSALTLALCGEAKEAHSLVDEMVRRFPQDSFFKTYWVPMTQALIEIHRNKPDTAVQLLEAARRGENGTNPTLWPAYIRGLAYLRQRSAGNAVGEFQKILDHRGALAPATSNPVSYSLYPLAHLGIARAAALSGDTARSAKAYEAFFALWKNADRDVPMHQAARQEHLTLNRVP